MSKEQLPILDHIPRSGALMFIDALQQEQWANPGDPMFSSVSMVATHFWKDGHWTPIFEDADVPDLPEPLISAGKAHEIFKLQSKMWYNQHCADNFKTEEEWRASFIKFLTEP